MIEHDMSTFWHWWVVILTLANIAGIYWLIRWTSKHRPGEVAEGLETGHSWDGLSEFNNPLPRWWLYMFYLTIVFSLIYLVLYPGLGRYAGILNWTQNAQYAGEIERADARYQPIFQAMAQQSHEQLIADENAMRTGQRLYLNYCATCHGSDAGGAYGFPNLANGVWQWGSSAQEIQHVIAHGVNHAADPQTRRGQMPGFATSLDDAALNEVTHYVLQLAGRPDADARLAQAGQTRYMMFCAGCHGAEGKGMPFMGATNFTANAWVYGGSAGAVRASIAEGRMGIMPGFGDLLGEERTKVLSAYVYGLGK
jgi:cytochrome c oxidase cbb3-type subunit 3